MTSFGQHAKALLMELKQSDWIPEYNATGVANVISEVKALSDEIMNKVKENNYRIDDTELAARAWVFCKT